MLGFKLINKEIVTATNDINFQIFNQDFLIDYLKENKLPIVINDIKNFNNSTNIGVYQKIIYGSFFLTKDTFKTTSTIFFIYQDDVLSLFTQENQEEQIVAILNQEILKHEFNFKQPIEITLLLTYIILDDLTKFALKTQNKIDKLENELINESEHKNFNHKLLGLKKQVIKLRKQVRNISNYLELYLYYYSNDETTSFALLLQHRATRLQNEIKDMNEHTIQIKELYQNQLDVNLNDTMNLFTIISAIFLPLTLITSWYGMNFIIKEYAWKYGYLVPIILSIITLVLVLYLIKKYRFLRKR